MIEVWAERQDRSEVYRIALNHGGLRASVLTYGAMLQGLWLEGHDNPLVLGFDSLLGYESQKAFIGAAIGRFANRIGGAAFTLDGFTYGLDANEGTTCLHGGSEGFHTRQWSIDSASDDYVTLSYVSADGEMGFPGRLTAQCRYRLMDDTTMEVSLRATTDSPTICSMTQHSYFNLDDAGETAIDGHRLHINAEHVLDKDILDLPTGSILPLDDHPADFRHDRVVGSAVCDHTLCLSEARGPLRYAATLTGRSGLQMEMETTEPGLQLYTGDFIYNLPNDPGIRKFGPRAGLCLEPQVWPDAPNQPHFPSAILRPGEVLEQVTRYRFSRISDQA